MSEAAQKKILMVEDDADTAESVKIVLEGEGYLVSHALNPEAGLAMTRAERPDLILLGRDDAERDGGVPFRVGTAQGRRREAEGHPHHRHVGHPPDHQAAPLPRPERQGIRALRVSPGAGLPGQAGGLQADAGGSAEGDGGEGAPRSTWNSLSSPAFCRALAAPWACLAPRSSWPSTSCRRHYSSPLLSRFFFSSREACPHRALARPRLSGVPVHLFARRLPSSPQSPSVRPARSSGPKSCVGVGGVTVGGTSSPGRVTCSRTVRFRASSCPVVCGSRLRLLAADLQPRPRGHPQGDEGREVLAGDDEPADGDVEGQQQRRQPQQESPDVYRNAGHGRRGREDFRRFR